MNGGGANDKAEESLAGTFPAEATIRDGTTMMVSLRAITTIGTLAIVIATMITAIDIASSAMACGFGCTGPTITLEAIANGCCIGPKSRAARIGGGDITSALTTTRSQGYVSLLSPRCSGGFSFPRQQRPRVQVWPRRLKCRSAHKGGSFKWRPALDAAFTRRKPHPVRAHRSA